MKEIFSLIFVLSILISQFGCKNDSTAPSLEVDTSSVIDRKPNLYIYSTKEINLKVKIIFPVGGRIIAAIPDYRGEWRVTVKPDGSIDDLYQYLFYECSVPDLTQKKFGWIIAKENLKSFFEENMTLTGFNQKEIKDFVEYWIPILKDYNYYEIYPQYISTLEQMSVIEFSICPDNVYRLQYLIKGRNNRSINLPKPRIEIAKREGFFVMEWGVILL